jgi:hypothetical protein
VLTGAITNNPFEPTQTEHPDELLKLQIDKSLTKVVQLLFAVTLLPMMLELVKPEDIILH